MTVIDLFPRPPEEPDPDMSEWMLAAVLPLNVWGRIIAAVEVVDIFDGVDLAGTLRGAIGRQAHPSIQIEVER